MAPRRTQPLCSSPAFSWKFIPSSAADTSVEGRARLKGGENTKAKGKQTVLPLRWSQPRCRASKGRQMATAPSPAQLTSFHQGYYIIPKLPARDHTKQKKEKREGTESFGRVKACSQPHCCTKSVQSWIFHLCTWAQGFNPTQAQTAELHLSQQPSPAPGKPLPWPTDIPALLQERPLFICTPVCCSQRETMMGGQQLTQPIGFGQSSSSLMGTSLPPAHSEPPKIMDNTKQGQRNVLQLPPIHKWFHAGKKALLRSVSTDHHGLMFGR